MTWNLSQQLMNEGEIQDTENNILKEFLKFSQIQIRDSIKNVEFSGK